MSFVGSAVSAIGGVLGGAGVGAAIGGIGSAIIGSRASKKASDAQKDASDDSLQLQADMFNRQDELARQAYKGNKLTISGTRKGNKGLAQAEKRALDEQARQQAKNARTYAGTAYDRNRATLTGARDDVLGDIARDRTATAQTLQEARNRGLALFQPAYDTGNNALLAYASELGLGDRPEGFAGLSLSPATSFLMNEGRTNVEGGAASAGGLYSGATLEALERMRMGLAEQDHDDQMAQLFGLAGIGQDAARSMGGIESDFADDYTANTRYWNGASADATGRYAGALAGLEDQNYSRLAGIDDTLFGNLGRAQVGKTDRMTTANNNYAAALQAARQSRAAIGTNAAQNYAMAGGNALQAYGDARAAGAVGTANAITGGINSGLGIYGYLGGTFGNPGTEVLGSSTWPMNKPPMPRPV